MTSRPPVGEVRPLFGVDGLPPSVAPHIPAGLTLRETFYAGVKMTPFLPQRTVKHVLRYRLRSSLFFFSTGTARSVALYRPNEMRGRPELTSDPSDPRSDPCLGLMDLTG